MRNRTMTPEHQEAAARRLAQLSSQLEAERAARASDAFTRTDVWGDTVATPAQQPSAAVASDTDGTGGTGGTDPAEDWWGDHTRVVAAIRPGTPVWPPAHQVAHVSPARPVAPMSPVERAGAVPMPGRHASRRSPVPGERTAGLTALVPEPLRGRVGLGPPHLAVVALLVAVGALAVAWFVVRGDPAAPVPIAVEQAAATTPPLAESLAGGESTTDDGAPSGATGAEASATEATGSTGSGGADGAGEVAGTVTVDVAGKVRRPGIAVLDVGSRVVDALDAAGGARPGVDLVALNLARVLVDGEQIVVGTPAGAAAPPVAGSVGGTTTTPGAPTALVDLNVASEPELEELPDVGPVTAAAIISWREENGGFTAVTELLEVDGIGDKTLEQLTPLVTV